MATAARPIATSDIPAAATLAALSNPVDFFDDFTAGAAAPFTSGRVPTVGVNPWTISGAGAAHARVGGAPGFTSSVAHDGGNIYALMKLNSGQIPAEVGGTFRWTGQAATLPTIAVIRDVDATGIDVMLHDNLYVPNLGEVQFASGYWLAGQVNVAPAFALSLFGNVGPKGTLALGQDYTRRLYLDQLPRVVATLEDATGTILATHVFEDPNLLSVVGPAVFFEGNGSDLRWSKVWAKTAVSAETRSLVAKLTGRGATPSFGSFSGLHAGSGSPFGALSARYDGSPSRRPGVRAVGNHAEFEVRSEQPGFGGYLLATNGGGATVKMGVDGSYAQKFSGVNCDDWLVKPANTDFPYLSSGLRVGGSAGPTFSSGAGSPEGTISAPPGSLFLRTDGAAGTSLYVKQSGTGAAGWAAK